ncbi:hypothetical protein [Rhodobacter sp. 24-YEA-8]|uniref:hypothetical protein n=1 Tax=Rhodobacter sp. 24-YEA-8 TaxID=1884310 RepID=UPI000B808F03|nr:hypothetical protein [Rhodobacter sp. 24-YEA-8]
MIRCSGVKSFCEAQLHGAAILIMCWCRDGHDDARRAADIGCKVTMHPRDFAQALLAEVAEGGWNMRSAGGISGHGR